jgi:uncharacterized protein (TIGR02001 family)
MKKLSVIVASLILAAVIATPALAAIEVGGSAYVGYFDKYLWRGYDLSGSLPVVQGGVNLSSNGFTLSYWSNIQTKTDDGAGLVGGEANETDIIIDYTFSPIDKLSVSIGNIWYALDGLADTKEAYLGLALDVPLAPALKVYYDYDQSEENGLFYTAAVSHSFDLMDKLSLSVGALVSYNDENYSAGEWYSDWHNYELSASATYAITDQISVTPSFVYSSPISADAKEAIDSETLGGVTVTLSF